MLSINDFNIIKEKAFCCVPYQYKNICNIYPYTVQEIIEMGTDKYFSSLGILILTKDDIAEIIKKKTNQSLKDEEVPEPFEYLIKSSELNDMFFLELQDIFSTFLKEDVLILPELNVVVVGDPKDKRFITSENFSDIQDILRIQNKKDVSPPPPPDETPGQRKMRLLREKTAKIKKKQVQKKGEGLTFVESLEIAETFGITLNHSVYAFYGLIQRHQYREKWQQDLQMICAGADNTKLKTKYWGESLNDE